MLSMHSIRFGESQNKQALLKTMRHKKALVSYIYSCMQKKSHNKIAIIVDADLKRSQSLTDTTMRLTPHLVEIT